MPELGIFHHSSLAATAAAYSARFADGPKFQDWVARFSADVHGDFSRWQQALANLPLVANPEVTLGDTVTVQGQLTPAKQAQLATALRHFMPWRKGPFQFFDTFVDTEWRSDWKWQRLAPHLPALQGQRILDVGCGNGYFGWRLLEAGAASVLGIDPTLLFCMQHLAVNGYIQRDDNWVLPLRFEDLPTMQFDGAMSLGVVYHRRDPLQHIEQLYAQLKPGGWLAVESLVVTGAQSLAPAKQPKQAPGHRYARMRNVWCVPTVAAMQDWLQQAGFTEATVVDESNTTLAEQRSTNWMQFESLTQALDPQDTTRTIEGYPAPRRAMVLARKPLVRTA